MGLSCNPIIYMEGLYMEWIMYNGEFITMEEYEKTDEYKFIYGDE